MKKMHLKKKIKFKHSNNLSKKLLLIVAISLLFILNIYTYKCHISPLLMNYAENKIKELASSIVTKSLNDSLLSKLEGEDLFYLTKENNKIKTIDFNSIMINKIIIDSLTLTRKKLVDGIEYKIPIGSLSNNPFFNNKGPRIKVYFYITNELSANLNNKVTPYGINNAIMETFINIDLIFKLIIPMSSKIINSNLSIPISIKIIEGEVPNYYLNGYNENSKILTLPVN